MHFYWFILTFSTIIGIQKAPTPLDPPAVFIDKDNKAIKNINGVWFHHTTKFSGYLIEFDGSQLISKIPILNGLENGTAIGWFVDGKKRVERSFRNGNRHGYHTGWYENGTLAFEYFFKDDKFEGEQKTYFNNGNKWQSLMYLHGYEEGKQKSWNEEGRLINNFTVKNRKLYGVIGRYDCMSVNTSK